MITELELPPTGREIHHCLLDLIKNRNMLSSKKRVLFDMDGVLTDFISEVPKTPEGEVDWTGLMELGSSFWENLKWIPEGKLLLSEVIKMGVPVGILSAIFYPAGVIGKKKWLSKNIPGIDEENIYIVKKGDLKSTVAGPNDILIDDMPKYVDKFNEKFPGHAILFTNFEETMTKLLNVLSKK